MEDGLDKENPSSKTSGSAKVTSLDCLRRRKPFGFDLDH
jgi:hypothetical protein